MATALTSKCAGCKSIIKGKDLLACVTCLLKYDLFCASLDKTRFNGMSKEQKRLWQCPECRSKQPKIDNTNTPIHSSNRVARSPTSDDVGLSPNESPFCSNVTMRSKLRPTTESLSDGLTLENIREVIKREMMAVVRVQVTEELKAIHSEITKYHDSMTFLNSQYEELKTKVEEKTTIISQLQSENKTLISTVSELSSRLTTAEQYLRESNLEVNGIPEHRSEQLVNTVIQLTKTVGNPVPESDILNVTRVAKLSRETNTPRSVVVKLRSPLQRDSVLAAVIKFNRANPADKLSSQHLGLGGPRVPVYVAEHLTPTNKALHAATRKKAKEVNYKFVWVRGGRIYVRKDESSQAHIIRNIEGLKVLS